MKKSSIFELDGIPSFGEALPLALQHVVAMIVGCITPAIIIANVAKLPGPDRLLLIQSALVVAGLTTLLQLFPIGKRSGFHIGAGLPVIMRISFVYVPSMQAIAGELGVGAILGAQIVGGVVAILVGLSVKRIQKFFPPLITGTVVFTIGLSLYPTAVNYMAGGASSADYGAWHNWIIASSFSLPEPFHFGINFDTASCIAIGLLFAINSVQAIGDFTATTSGAMNRLPAYEELKGGLPTASFSQNVGIVTTTKVINRCVLGLGALILLAAGIVPKFSALLTTIPQCVLGGATISVFASIAMAGMRLINTEKMTFRNTSIAGLSVALGMGVSQCQPALATFPSWVTMIFGRSPVVIATITAIFLNIVLPKE